MKYIVIILSVFTFWSCKKHSNNDNISPNENKQLQSTTTNLSVSNKSIIHFDTIKAHKEALKEWALNTEVIFLYPSEQSDEFYTYSNLKIGSVESGKFIKIPKKDSPYTGFEKIVVKFPYFTIEQSYREGDYTNYEYITFKKEAQSIYFYKYAVDYTNIHNLDENISNLRLDQKTIGKVRMENVNSQFLASLRSTK